MQHLQTQSWLPSMPPKIKLPLYVERNWVKGRYYYGVRVKGVRLGRLPDDHTSPEFFEAYAAIMRTVAADPKPVKHAEGSVAWLMTAYKSSPAYRSLAAKTQVSYARELDRLAVIGTFPAVEVKRRHINAIRDTLAGTPRTRQLFGQVCSLLFNFGIGELDLEMMNPARRMRRDGDAESYAAWTDAQMTAFEASSPPCHVMTAYMIARYAGPRRGDLVKMMRSHYDGATLAIAGGKTSNPVVVPVHPVLRTCLDGLPATLYLIADAKGTPVTDSRLSKDIRAHLDVIGLDLSLHGLRHTAGKALAEAGCSPHEIQAVLGHKTLQMVERYTKAAGQKRMAGSAILKLTRSGK